MPGYTIEIEGEYVYIGVYNLILFLRVLIYRCTMYSQSVERVMPKNEKKRQNEQRISNGLKIMCTTTLVESRKR